MLLGQTSLWSTDYWSVFFIGGTTIPLEVSAVSSPLTLGYRIQLKNKVHFSNLMNKWRRVCESDFFAVYIFVKWTLLTLYCFLPSTSLLTLSLFTTISYLFNFYRSKVVMKIFNICVFWEADLQNGIKYFSFSLKK